MNQGLNKGQGLRHAEAPVTNDGTGARAGVLAGGGKLADNFTHVYTSGDTGEAPDQQNDSGTTFGLDWDFANSAPNFWILTIKADVVTEALRKRGSSFPIELGSERAP